MKPISMELSKALSKDFEEILTDEHNESEMYLADTAEALVLTHGISPGVANSILEIIRKYGELKRREGETAATLKIVVLAVSRFDSPLDQSQ